MNTIPIEVFAAAIIRAGVEPAEPLNIVPDGELHRFRVVEDKGGKKTGWYIFHADGIPAGTFGDWRKDIKENWCSKKESQFTPEERAAYRRRIEEDRGKRKAERLARHLEASKRAEVEWSSARPATPDHPYLIAKSVMPHGLKVDVGGRLLVPLNFADGKIWTLEYITPNGDKRFMYGGRKKGCFFPFGTVDEVIEKKIIIVGEGFATSATLHEATGLPAAAAMDAGNLKAVAEAIHKANHEVEFLFAADNDKHKRGEKAAREAAQAVGGRVVVCSVPGDFNDLARVKGLVAVKAEIDTALKTPEPERNGVEPENAQVLIENEDADLVPGMPALNDFALLDLSILGRGRADPPQLPLEVFGEKWSGWLLSSAEGAGAPVDYAAAGLIATTSAMIGNSRWVSPWSGWAEPPILWEGVVGDPGDGKTPGLGPVLEPIRSIEMILASSFAEKHREWEGANMAAKAAREKWEKAVRAAVQNDDPPPEMPASAVAPEAPTLPRIRISDATQEAIGHLCAANPRGLLFFRDELTGWIGNFDRYGGNGGDRAFWLEAYDGKARVIDRVKFEGKPIIIPRLTVGILGGIQPDRLSSAILEGEDDGLAARFQWVWPDPIPPRRPTRSGDADFAKSAISRLLQLNMSANAEGELGPVIVRLEEKAVSLFHEWRLVHYKQRESVGGGIASSYAKAPGQLLRLSLVLEFLWWAASPDSSEPSYVSAKAIGAAAHLIETYFKPMAMRVYGDASLPKGDRLASVLAKWIIRERPQVVNAREVRRSARLPGLRVSGDVVLALTSLVEGGWLRKASQSGSGRPRSDFEVNPILWERLS